MNEFVVACTPRSGSTLLAADLTASGVGHVAECLNHVNGPQPEALAACRAHHVVNDTWGVKLMWNQHAAFAAATGRDMAAEVPDATWFHLIRTDRVAQTVSLYRAIATNRWSSLEPPASPPPIDVDHMVRLYCTLTLWDELWRDWLYRNVPSHYAIYYDDYIEHRADHVEWVAGIVGAEVDVKLSTELTLVADDWNDAAADELAQYLPFTELR